MYMGGSSWKRLVEKIAEKTGVSRSADFPWSKGIPDRNFPRPMTGGSGCLASIVLVWAIPLMLLGFLLF
jgi:hypothetical protein